MLIPVILSSISMFAIRGTEATPQYYHMDLEKRQDFINAPTTTTKKETTTKPPASTTKAATTSKAAATTKASTASAVKTSSAVQTTSVALTSTDPINSISPTTSLSASTSATSSGVLATSTSSNSTSSNGLSGGAIGGIVAAIVIIIAGIVAYLFVRRRANQKQRINNNPRFSKATFGQQPPMQQQQQYQHQYGTNVNPPSSPFAFEDANQHIITPTTMQQPIQQYQPAIANNYNNDSYITSPTAATYPPMNEVAPPTNTYNTAPVANVNYTAPVVNPSYTAPVTTELVNTATAPPIVTTSAPDAGTGVAIASGAAAVATTAATTTLQPTQPGSLGVFTVIATYTPTLSDEVDIQTGDQVEVLVEYDDGWCQGINLSRGNAKGVFPKHCTNFGSNTAPSISSAKRVSSMYIP